MFTWICPQCGREVPPAYTECPDCTQKAAGPQAPAAPNPHQQPPAQPESTPRPAQGATSMFQAPAQPSYQPPPQPAPAYQPPAGWQPPQDWQPPQSQQPQYQPPPSYQQPPPAWQPHSGLLAGQSQYSAAPGGRRGLPTWLMTIVFALAFVGLVFGAYSLIGYMKGSGGTSAPSAAVESPAAKPGARVNPFQKYIEITGVRFTVDAKKKPAVTFIVVNHLDHGIDGLGGNVTIWGRTQKSEEDAAGTFSFKTDIGPNGIKELTAPLNTKKSLIEMPDWQNISTDIQVTSPSAS